MISLMICFHTKNIQDPSSPVLLSTTITPGMADGLAVSGAVLYVADGAFGIASYDIYKNGDFFANIEDASIIEYSDELSFLPRATALAVLAFIVWIPYVIGRPFLSRLARVHPRLEHTSWLPL